MKTLLLILVLTNAFCCYGQKPVVFSRERIKIDSILVLPPFTRTYVISKLSTQKIDQKLSTETFDATYHLLKRQFPTSIKATFLLPDSLTQIKLNNFVRTTCKRIDYELQAKKFVIPDSILSLFKSANTDFIFCLANDGFIRVRENLVRTQLASDIAGALIGYDQRPLQSSSLMVGLILDLKRKQIVYFERNIWANKDPRDISVLKLQVNRMLTHCFLN